MFMYQLKLVVAENKLDKFVDSLRYLSSGIRKERGCLDFSLYRYFQKKNLYRVLGEWKTSGGFKLGEIRQRSV
jgi:quinol monooxygenase YgiN